MNFIFSNERKWEILKGFQSSLTPKQEKAIMALLTEPTIKKVAELVGVGESTLYRWFQEDEFNQAFRDARKRTFPQSISHLQQATTTAVYTLKEIMENSEASSSSRVTAAKTVIEMAYRAYEMEDLSAEIEEIKEYIAKTNSRQTRCVYC